jgi:hypothetical protein
MPSRVIEVAPVDPVQTPRLRDTRNASFQSGPYAALSYCWGGDQSVKLTKSTKQCLLRELPHDQLPRTLRDAITTTRTLGIRFLWIDCLCIVQDDPEDMTKELSDMPRIYTNALVTISAGCAASAEDGFLGLRKEVCSSNRFRLPFRCEDGGIGSIFLHDIPGIPGTYTNEPINKRAWTLQERLLSPRVLDYGTWQLRWICSSVRDRPGYVDGWTMNDQAMVPVHPDLPPSVPASNSLFDKKDEFLNKWNTIVKEYTARDLTNASDKLIALAALAEHHNRTTNDDYMAGLWASSLPEGLLWRVMGAAVKRRPPGYRAPSWSWACLDDRIEPQFYSSSSAMNDRLQILEHKIRLANPNIHFGSVTSAHLVVRGRIQHVLFKVPSAIDLSSLLSLSGLQHPDLQGPSATLGSMSSLDAQEEALTTDDDGLTSVVCLEVSVGSDDRQRSEGLILLPRGDKCFSRLGVYSVWASNSLARQQREQDRSGHHDPAKTEPRKLGHGYDWSTGFETRTITLI